MADCTCNNFPESLGNVTFGARVGVGVASPAHKLAVGGGLPSWTTALWGGALELPNASAVGWQPNAEGNLFGLGQTTGGVYLWKTTSPLGNGGYPATYLMKVDDNGRIGIGTVSPQTKLEVMSDPGVPETLRTSYNPYGTNFRIKNEATAANENDQVTLEGFRQNGASIGRIVLAGGKVGIGTTENPPQTRLEVVSEVGVPETLRTTYNPYGTNFRIKNEATAANTNDKVTLEGFRQNGTSIGRIVLAGGKVGIGTTQDPQARLEVLSDVGVFETLRTTYNPYGTNFRISNQADAPNNNDKVILEGFSQNGASIGKIVLAGGNVGIGRLAPLWRLDVGGVIRATQDGGTNSGVELAVVGQTSYVQSYDRAAAQFRDLVLRGSSVGLGGGGATASLLVDALGNVGIGTPTPGHRLDVAGAIRTSAGGVFFPDGTQQVTAAGGGGTPVYWVAVGANLYNSNVGNVGIGTASPQAKLEVAGGAVRVGGRTTIDAQGYALYS